MTSIPTYVDGLEPHLPLSFDGIFDISTWMSQRHLNLDTSRSETALPVVAHQPGSPLVFRVWSHNTAIQLNNPETSP